MTIYKRCLSTLFLVALASFRAAAQPVLLHGAASEPREIATVGTYAGPVKASLAPVEISDQVLIAVLTDTIAASQQDRVRTEILSVYQDPVNARPAKKMLLGILQGQELTRLGPFRSRAQLHAALRKLWSEPFAGQAPDAATLYRWLVNSAGQLGSNWSSAVLIGSLPDVRAPLRDYAAAWLANRLVTQQVRTSYWNPDGPDPGWFTEVCQATGGVCFSAGLGPLGDLLNERKSAAEVTWQPPTAVRGFLLYRAKLITPAGAVAGEFPAIGRGAGVELPDLARYAELRQHVENARELASEAHPTQEQAGQIRAELEAAVHINPSDAEALRVGADFYKRFNDYATTAQLLAILAETQPLDAALLSELGHAYFVTQQVPEAEKVLLRARELGGGDARVAEELARVHVARQDDTGALPFIEESLAKEGGNQPLWYLRADVAARLKDWSQQTASLERGIALGGDTLERRTSLVRLYLDHQAVDKALPHIQVVIGALPNDAKVGRTYAEFLDELHRSGDALTVWRKVLDLDPTLEPAHFRVTRLLMEAGSLHDALTSTDAGLAAAPKSARLYVAKSEILEKLGTFYEARDVLRRAAVFLDDSALLGRLSEFEDISGRAAAQSYLRLAEVLEKTSPSSPEYRRALERGMEVAWRDNDAETAVKCATKLAVAGQQGLDVIGLVSHNQPKGTPVPGGLEALAFIAHSKRKSPPQRFFVEFAKAVRLNTVRNDKGAKAYVEAIQQHFQLVAAVEALGMRDHDVVKFRLSLEDKKSQRQTEKLLNLLGWKLRVSKNATTLDAGEKGGQAKRQETTSALAIDEAGMQEALEARQSFEFEVRDETAPVLLGEDVWRKAFYPKENLPGGFAEALSRDLRMAKVYAGLSVMDKDALTALLAGTELKVLADKYADLIYWYAPALALRQDHAAVPGGSAAEPIWEKVAGASPARPAQFFHSLLEKDDGKVLVYYATLAQLDLPHQRFFMRNQSRTSRFYELFRQSPEVSAGAGKETLRTTFFEFLREVPLDQQGSVDFPGSPEIWMVAKGQASPSAIASHLKKVAKVAAPDQEDEILLRLARTHYKSSQTSYSELDNFVAVARIDAHRSDPLDDASALLLADQFAENRAAYPYFACLTDLTSAHVQSFFNMSVKLKAMPEVELNSVLGEFHAIAQLLCLTQESGALPARQTAEFFGQLADRFSQASSPADFAAASLELLRKMLPPGAADPDEAIRALLLGRSAPVAFDLDGSTYQADWSETRDTDFRHVLELQKVTPLAVLYRLYDAARGLIANQSDAAKNIAILETASAALPVVDVPKTLHMKGKLREDLQAFQRPSAVSEIATLRQKSGRGKLNQKDVEKLCRQLLADINPQVRIALTGILYGYYLRPGDLLVSEDPLFLRKHQFVELGTSERHSPFRDTPELEVSSEDAGSYLEGGFAGFSRIAGRVAASSGHRAGDSEMVFASQIGSLRATDWRNISDHAMLVFGLRVRLAREWIEHASRNPELLPDLADGALGVLSLGRRAALLNALHAGDWQAVWQSVTLSDLYFLSDSYLARYQTDPWDSPLTHYFRRMPANAGAAQLAGLGASHPYLNGCDHPHLIRLAPYEEYERVMMPTAMAERVSEFKVYLLEYGGEAGIPAAALGTVAESVVLDVLRKTQMADMKDWRQVALAYASVGEQNIRAALH